MNFIDFDQITFETHQMTIIGDNQCINSDDNCLSCSVLLTCPWPSNRGFLWGKNAGSVSRGITAAILPGIVVGGIIFVASGPLAGLPVVRVIAGAGAIVLAAMYSIPVIGGAVVGGLLAKGIENGSLGRV